MSEDISRGRRKEYLVTLVAALVIGAIAVGAYQAIRDIGPSRVHGPSSSTEPVRFSQFADVLIAKTPGAWKAGDGAVVVPGDISEETTGMVMSPQRVGPPVTLPSHAVEFVRQWRAPGAGKSPGPDEFGSVVTDRGPALLACTRWPDRKGCVVSVGHLEGKDFFYDFGVGSETFQQPGSKMEVFVLTGYTPTGEDTLVLAGGPGAVESAVVILDDGTKIPATVTSAVGAPTGSMYFATTTGTPVRVVAHGADGRVVEDHKIRDCVPGENCEVR